VALSINRVRAALGRFGVGVGVFAGAGVGVVVFMVIPLIVSSESDFRE
jgi:hypothetical protein